jgi:hypothetical protein
MSERPAPKVPAHIRPYVDALGLEKAVELFLTFGGSGIYLSKRPQERGDLGAVLSVSQILALTREIGTGYISLPMPKQFLMRHFHHQGLSANKIARKLHTTAATVYRNVASSDARQIDLFEI